MTPGEMVTAVRACGGELRHLGNGQRSLAGEVPEELMAAIKADRDAFVDAWDSYERDRYCRVPEGGLPLRAAAPSWRQDVYLRVEKYIRGQGPEVLRWILLQTDQYRARGGGWSDRDLAAASMSDLLQWQMGRFGDAVAQLKTLDEVVATWPAAILVIEEVK